MVTDLIFGGLLLVVVMLMVYEERDLRRFDLDEALVTYEDAMAIEPEPDFQIDAWTPEEREVLGHNDLLRWIAETDRVLNEIDWERRAAAMTPPTNVHLAQEGAFLRRREDILRRIRG